MTDDRCLKRPVADDAIGLYLTLSDKKIDFDFNEHVASRLFMKHFSSTYTCCGIMFLLRNEACLGGLCKYIVYTLPS